jgi:hypothetical protein
MLFRFLPAGCAMIAAFALPPLGQGAERAAGSAHDGPFGLYMGEPLAALGRVTPNGQSTYDVLSPPKPLADFDTLRVSVYPATGLCDIMGIQHVKDDPSATKAMRSVDDLVSALKTKYGDYQKKLDTCDADEHSCRTFRTELLSEQRSAYAYTWEFSDGARPDRIGRVAVAANASNATMSVVLIYYQSADKDACEAAQNAARAGGL